MDGDETMVELTEALIGDLRSIDTPTVCSIHPLGRMQILFFVLAAGSLFPYVAEYGNVRTDLTSDPGIDVATVAE